MRRIQMLPNLVTLGNAFCGLLAIAKAVDALALQASRPAYFYARIEQACMLVFLAMIFDALDGFVARLTRSESEMGAQLDSFSDALTFGVTPAILTLVVLGHESPLIGWNGGPRLHFLAAASYSLLAILRLARFNIDTGEDETHAEFRGLPSPGAAGAVVSTLWLYLILRRPELEVSHGEPTPFGRLMRWMQDVEWAPILDRVPPLLIAYLPLLGLLMVSRLRFAHAFSFLTHGRRPYDTLVWLLFVAFLVYLAPVPALFVAFSGYVAFGTVRGFLALLRPRRGEAPPLGN